jgi:hypothetical protein
VTIFRATGPESRGQFLKMGFQVYGKNSCIAQVGAKTYNLPRLKVSA